MFLFLFVVTSSCKSICDRLVAASAAVVASVQLLHRPPDAPDLAGISSDTEQPNTPPLVAQEAGQCQESWTAPACRHAAPGVPGVVS